MGSSRMKRCVARAGLGLGACFAMALGADDARAQQAPPQQYPAGVQVVPANPQAAPPPQYQYAPQYGATQYGSTQYPPPYAQPVEAPRTIDWQDGEPAPRGYHVVERTRTGLVVGGAVTFGCLYLITLLVAAGNTDAANKDHTSSTTDALYIPAIGPFIQMTKSGSATANVFLLVDGVAQTAGVAMFVAGLTWPKTVLVRDGSTGAPKLAAVPLVGPGMSGAGLLGTF